MDPIVASGINLLNTWGRTFCAYAWNVLLQSSVLIVLLLLLDLVLRRRVRAVVRYAVWLLVFVKLLLPPALALPTGIAYYWPHHTAALPATPESVTVKMAPVSGVREIESQPAPGVARTAEANPAGDVDALAPATVPGATRTLAAQAAIVWQSWVFLAWFGGLLALGICLMRRFLYVGRLTRAGTAAPASSEEIAAECAALLGLRRCPQVRLSEDVSGPVVCGLLQPVVLMPAMFPHRVNEERLRTVLVHELAHIKRADLWVNFVQTLLLIAYFYHPLLWLVNAIVRRLREQAVDETVLVALDAEAKGYSTALIGLAEMTFTKPILGLRLIGIAESRKALEGRIRHMMTRPKPKTARIGAWGLLAILVTVCILLPMARAQTTGTGWLAAREAENLRGPARASEGLPQPSGYRVVAPPLTSLERHLVQQLVDLARQMDQQYPEECTHWPAGPGIYHVDDRGRVTVWHYRELWRRSKDCAETEVGWGSSELVNALGMYYLPDGTPLASRWSERGNGMKDIRVDVGRIVAEGERVGLIHRHELSEKRDLWSRDGRQRTMLIDSYDDQPVEIVVRIDEPADLGSWWVGDVAANVQLRNGYKELILSGPPSENRGPVLVTVAMPVGSALEAEDGKSPHIRGFWRRAPSRERGWKIWARRCGSTPTITPIASPTG